MRLRYVVLLLIPLLLVLGLQLSTAQTDTGVEVCSAFIEEAIQTVGNNCGLLDRNSACYGFNTVNASFIEPQAEGFFTLPNERTPINVLSSIATTPLRTELDQWGIALLSVQANLPETLPGQSVIFMLLGDTEVENAVSPEDTYVPGEIISVTMQTGGNLYYQPRLDADLLDFVPETTSLQADAVSSDSAFVRVVYRGVPGWVATGALAGGVDLSGLSIIAPETRTPGQAFFLRTNIGQTECAEAPDSLIVQGPQDLKVDLKTNGADIRIGSTIVLRVIGISDEQKRILQERFGFDDEIAALLELTTLDGEGILDPDTPGEQIVPAGSRAFRCLAMPEDIGLDQDDNDNEVIEECPWFGFEDLPPEAIREFGGFEGITLNYPIVLPLDGAPPTPTDTPVAGVFIPIATNTPRPTNTLVPATNTPVFSTNTFTPVPPTATATGTLPTSTATNTLAPPTSTPTHTATSTFAPPTSTPTHTATSTFAPPTSTATHTATSTFAPPTSTPTNTPVPPTSTPTSTSVPPTNTPTNTPVPPSPTPTNTPPAGCLPAIPNPVATVAELICSIELANDEINYPGQDIINLTSDTIFSFTAVYGSGSALPAITSNIVIVGNSSTLTRVPLSPAMRYFTVAASGTLELQTLSVNTGISSSPGGAIDSTGTLIIKDSSFASNHAVAPEGNGGAIHQKSGSLAIYDSVFVSNTADNFGGAIYVEDAAFVMDVIDGTTLVQDNTAGENGGGIHIAGSSVTYSITSTNIDDNHAELGGGIYDGAVSGSGTLNMVRVINNDALNGGGIYTTHPMTITHSTVDSNLAAGGYGGIYSCTTGTLIQYSTVSRNSAEFFGGIFGCDADTMTLLNSTVARNFGAGIRHEGALNISFSTIAYNSGVGLSLAGSTSIRNSIVAGNSGSDCNGAMNASGVNYSDDASCVSLSVVTTAQLDLNSALTDNGGPTETHNLGDASIATDDITIPSCTAIGGAAVTTDQRGFPRPSFTACDPGAVENQNTGGLGALDSVNPGVTIDGGSPSEATEEATAEATEEATPELTEEATEEATAEATASPEATAEATATPEATAEATATPEATPEPTATLAEPTPTLPEPTPTLAEATATLAQPSVNGELPSATPTSEMVPGSEEKLNIIAARALDFRAWMKGW